VNRQPCTPGHGHPAGARPLGTPIWCQGAHRSRVRFFRT